jgi:hypothetical protein
MSSGDLKWVFSKNDKKIYMYIREILNFQIIMRVKKNLNGSRKSVPV